MSLDDHGKLDLFGYTFKGTYNDRICVMKRINFTTEPFNENDLDNFTMLSAQHPNVAQVLNIDVSRPLQECVVMNVYIDNLSSFSKHASISQFYGSGRFHSLMLACQSDLQRLLLAQDVVQGMIYLHSKGVVHGNLKPSNVLLAKENDRFVGKVSEYGIVRITHNQASLANETYHARECSTCESLLTYQPPEVIAREPPEGVKETLHQVYLLVDKLTKQSDVFSLCCLLLECACGRAPEPRDSSNVSEKERPNSQLEMRRAYLLELEGVWKQLDGVIRKGLDDAFINRCTLQEILTVIEEMLSDPELKDNPVERQISEITEERERERLLLNSEKEQLLLQLRAAEGELHASKNIIKELEDTNSDLKEKNDALKEKLESVQEQLKYEEEEKQLREADTQHTELAKGTIEDLKLEKRELKQTLHKKEESCLELIKKVAALEALFKEKENEIKNVSESERNSWIKQAKLESERDQLQTKLHTAEDKWKEELEGEQLKLRGRFDEEREAWQKREKYLNGELKEKEDNIRTLITAKSTLEGELKTLKELKEKFENIISQFEALSAFFDEMRSLKESLENSHLSPSAYASSINGSQGDQLSQETMMRSVYEALMKQGMIQTTRENIANLDTVPEESQLQTYIVDQHANMWKQIGTHLGILHAGRSQIDADYGSVQDKCFETLMKWKNGEGKAPKSWNTLLTALEASNINCEKLKANILIKSI